MKGRNIALALGAALLAIQLVPVPRDNPPVESDVPASEEVREILRRACYDCHSHEVRWPWYGYVAPVSWLVAYDVHEAREHLNFSTWSRYDAEEQEENLEEAWEEVEEGEMPLFFYVWLHPDAKLSEADRDAIREWSAEGRQAGSSQTASKGGRYATLPVRPRSAPASVSATWKAGSSAGGP